MSILNLEHINRSIGERTILSDVNASMDASDRIGVVGINGAGKSTLLAIAAGRLEADSGNVIMKKDLRISYLSQEMELDPEKSILDNVINEVSGKADHWDKKGEARSMLIKLGIHDPESTVSTLSGGQKKRALLAAALLTPCDLLILDEPTNHLDHEMIDWLEEWLRNFRGALLMVTHDRYFLDEVTDKIWELDKSRLYAYTANYSGYLMKKQERLDFAMAAERRLAALYKQDLKWMMRGARARSTKQKAHIQRFEALRDREKLIEERTVSISSVPSRLGRTTVELEGISKSYDGRLLFKDFTYIFLKNDRVGIIGPNGCGKSTLLKIILGLEKPDSGAVTVGQTVSFGYFSQENEYLNENERVIDCVRNVAEYILTNEGRITASAMCERFLFDGNMQYTPISKLSGGEKRRLSLLKVLMGSPNVLILDEPTNDLDIVTLQVLEDYLDTFPGIVITVSHDRYFLDRVVSRIFAFGPDGHLMQSEGGYAEYLLHMEERGLRSSGISGKTSGISGQTTAAAAVTAAATVTSAAKVTSAAAASVSKVTDPEALVSSAAVNTAPTGKVKPKSQPKKLSYKEQREYDSLEAEIDQMTERSKELDAEILKAASDYVRLRELTEEKEKLDTCLDEKIERYIELQEKIEAFNRE